MKQEQYTLITGGSMGIGKAFAHEFARRGHSILLVALQDTHLEHTRQELQESYSVKVDSFGVDLSAKEGPKCVWNWVQEKGYRINILVNNAGFGRNGLLESHSWEEYERMIHLNNRAMVEMTYLFVPMLKEQAHPTYVLNMSSMEVPLILPYKAVYSATKNFVFAFSISLREELKPFGVSVTTVCPGPVVTNEDGWKRIQTQGQKAKMIVLMPEQVAHESANAMFREKQLVIPGRVPYLVSKVAHLVPWRFRMPILEKMFRMYKQG